MNEERYMFGAAFAELIEHTRASLELQGFTVRLERSTLLNRFEMVTLVATPAPRPIRAERGCNLHGA